MWLYSLKFNHIPLPQMVLLLLQSHDLYSILLQYGHLIYLEKKKKKSLDILKQFTHPIQLSLKQGPCSDLKECCLARSRREVFSLHFPVYLLKPSMKKTAEYHTCTKQAQIFKLLNEAEKQFMKFNLICLNTSVRQLSKQYYPF